MPALSYLLHASPTCPCWQGDRVVLYAYLSKDWFPASSERGFITASALKLFTESMTGIANGNYVDELNLIIVTPVSSSLPKDGSSPPCLFPWAFFCQFPVAQRKNPQPIPMRVSLSSLVPSSQAWILWANHAANRERCLHALQHN
jgi:hypothetical protein